MDILKDLKERELLYQITDEESLKERFKKEPIVLYIGFDPTADSLHLGNLLGILLLKRFQSAGHLPIAVIGGGTGLIGDPSGKNSERILNPKGTVEEWTENIKKQLMKFLDFDSEANKARIVNNYEWLSDIKVIDFLRDIGKYFSINTMIAKESVKSRLETGISYTEFAYMVLQAYDFLRLHQDYHCEMQLGGSDQWGNITAGVDLIRKMTGKQVYGFTHPLVIKSDGTKFGKTETGTIWLDSKKTTPYQFYQFWFNTDDKDVVKFLKYFTFLSIEEISVLEKKVKNNPEKREAQVVLAKEVTSLVHGEEEMLKSEKISQALFYGKIKDLTEKELEDGLEDMSSSFIKGEREMRAVDFLVEIRVSSSKRQAKEDIKNGAVFINGKVCSDTEKIIRPSDRIFGKYIVIRRGKKSYFLVKWAK